MKIEPAEEVIKKLISLASRQNISDYEKLQTLSGVQNEQFKEVFTNPELLKAFEGSPEISEALTKINDVGDYSGTLLKTENGFSSAVRNILHEQSQVVSDLQKKATQAASTVSEALPQTIANSSAVDNISNAATDIVSNTTPPPHAVAQTAISEITEVAAGNIASVQPPAAPAIITEVATDLTANATKLTEGAEAIGISPRNANSEQWSNVKTDLASDLPNGATAAVNNVVDAAQSAVPKVSNPLPPVEGIVTEGLEKMGEATKQVVTNEIKDDVAKVVSQNGDEVAEAVTESVAKGGWKEKAAETAKSLGTKVNNLPTSVKVGAAVLGTLAVVGGIVLHNNHQNKEAERTAQSSGNLTQLQPANDQIFAQSQGVNKIMSSGRAA